MKERPITLKDLLERLETANDWVSLDAEITVDDSKKTLTCTDKNGVFFSFGLVWIHAKGRMKGTKIGT